MPAVTEALASPPTNQDDSPQGIFGGIREWIIQKLANLVLYSNTFAWGKRATARKGMEQMRLWGAHDLNLRTPSGHRFEAMVLSPGRVAKSLEKRNLSYHGEAQGFAKPGHKVTHPEAAVLLFEGAGGIFGCHENRLSRLLDMGFHVYAFNYPGMGESEGQTCRQSILESAEEMYRVLREQRGEDAPLLLFGNSLGGAPASYLAQKYQKPGMALLLDCPNARLRQVVADIACRRFGNTVGNYAADSFKAKHELDTESYIKGYTGPFRLIYAEEDSMVSFSQTKAVANAWPGSEGCDPLVQMPGGHWGPDSWRMSVDPAIQHKLVTAIVELEMAE